MNAVIKAASANGSVRPLAVPHRAFHDAVSSTGLLELEETAAPDEEEESLLREIAELKEALAAAEDIRSEAEERARDEGRLEAEAGVDAVNAERLEVLEAGIEAMQGSWDQRLGDLEAFAVALADSALSKLFDSWDEASEFVVRTIARQVRLLRRDAVIAIRVSREDFPDEQAMAALASRAATGSIRLVVDPVLAAGECLADLKLGQVDLGAKGQRAQLAALLEFLLVDEDRQ